MGALQDLLKIAPKLAAGDAQLVMRELYEKHYGIADHDKLGDSRPYLSIAMHPAENVTEETLLDERAEDFARLKVGKHFHLSFAEFLQFPQFQVLKILSICEKLEKEDSKAAQELNQQMQQLQQKS